MRHKEAKYNPLYRSRVTSEIDSLLKRPNVITIESFPGMGLSNLLRFICFNKIFHNRSKYLSKSSFAYCDMNILFDFSVSEYLNLMINAILEQSPEIPDDNKAEIRKRARDSQHIHDLISVLDGIVDIKGHLVICLNDYHLVANEKFENLSKVNHYIKNRYSRNLSLIIGISDRKICANNIYLDLVNNYIIRLELLNISEFKIAIERSNYQRADYLEMYKLTGGYPRYMKVLENINYNPTLHNIQFLEKALEKTNQKLAEQLSQEEIDLLTSAARTKSVRIHPLLIDGKLFTKAFEKYILSLNTKTNPEDVLTPNEHLLYNSLDKNANRLVRKSEIIEVLWGKDNKNKYDDWALSQTVKRLRSKLKQYREDEKIITIRGRGYKLIKQSKN